MSTILLLASLPQEQGNIRLPDLSATTQVDSDTFGIPTIHAATREDAFRTLGFLHARDRLFQMELMRRKSAGRLAELFGSAAVPLDRQQRSYQLATAAHTIVTSLPIPQRQVLNAYVAGVNSYLQQAKILAPEFLALQLTPEPWRAEDSILVALGMFQTLNGQEQDERMLSVMETILPHALVEFLTPDTDMYSTPLLGGTEPRRFRSVIPVSAFANLPTVETSITSNPITLESTIAGSNNWVVSGSKTIDGRSMIANDMHLGLSVPNIWYRADLQYQNRHIFGVTLPGVPAIIIGGNDFVAWGFTNVTADLLDLIKLEINPNNAQEYRTPQGWMTFATQQETIHIKHAPDINIEVRNTLWGPVSEQSLLGVPVAVKWTALAPNAVDLGLLDMDQVQSTQQAMTLMNQIGGPPQNVVFADREGHIGWTYMGRFPLRIGFDGLASRFWADGQSGWQGFIAADKLPRLFDPPEGFIVTANNRTLGRDYPYTIAHNWALGYRAFRISELLREGSHFSEQDLLNIQLDTRSEVLDFYQQLALTALQEMQGKDALLQTAEQALRAWEGYMQSDSRGAIFVSEFRKQLAREVFAKVVNACRAHDPNFSYTWREMETPLHLLLTRHPKGVLRTHYHDDWQLLIREILQQTSRELQKQYPGKDIAQLTWGEAHSVSIQHPFSKAAPWLARFLDMPSFAMDGCPNFCVKIMGNEHSASERLVLAPQHPENGILHMPGGQSGHPLAQHYRDQQPFWQNGIATPLHETTIVNTLHFVPHS